MAAQAAVADGYRTVVAAGEQPVALYAEETGSGPPLLLLHGLGASTFTWRHIVPALARTHRVITLDLMGFGRSDKPYGMHYGARQQGALVAAFIRKRGLSDVTLIGHSFGGTVVLETALALRREEGRVSRLVIMDAPALRQTFPGISDVIQTPLLPYVLTSITPPELMSRAMLRAVSIPGRRISEADVRGYAAPYYTLGSRYAFISTAQSIMQANAAPMGKRYPLITQPTLVVWCRGDNIVPLGTGRRLARMLPNARLSVLDRCNHLPQDEIPGVLMARLRGFLP